MWHRRPSLVEADRAAAAATATVAAATVAETTVAVKAVATSVLAGSPRRRWPLRAADAVPLCGAPLRGSAAGYLCVLASDCRRLGYMTGCFFWAA